MRHLRFATPFGSNVATTSVTRFGALCLLAALASGCAVVAEKTNFMSDDDIKNLSR